MRANWTPRDIWEFMETYPDAYNFLLRRSNFNEYRHLETNYTILNDWEKSRLKELSALFDYSEIAKANVADMLFTQKQEERR